MNEDDLKTKWCPHVRASSTAVDGWAANKQASGEIKDKHLCIGSDCAMYRKRKITSHKNHMFKSWCGFAAEPSEEVIYGVSYV